MTSAELPGLAAARLWAAARFPYLASGIFGAQVIATPDSGTVAVDEEWRLRADPVMAADWSPAQLGSVLVHHVCHLLRSHAERARALGIRPEDGPAWTRAADAEINDDLIPAGLDLPGTPVLPEHLGAEPGGLAEQYFRAARGDGRGWDLDCGSGADGRVRPGPDGPPGLPRWQAGLLRHMVAQETMRHAREAGTVPAGLARWAEAILARRSTGAPCSPPNCAAPWPTPPGRPTTPTGGRHAVRPSPVTSCCPPCAGRSRRSRWSATPRAA